MRTIIKTIKQAIHRITNLRHRRREQCRHQELLRLLEKASSASRLTGL